MKVLLLPGLSLMELTPIGDGAVRLRCPGCGSVAVLRIEETGTRAFVHEDDCPVHARIEAAIAAYERQHVNRG